MGAVVTGRLLWLPAALKDAGLRVNVVGGWERRGEPQMHPRVVVLHHTAAPKGRNAPSLGVCIDGRSDLPGPLCHVLIGRDGTCHVIASGRANHAGVGSWRGVKGNANAIGIEVENVGTKAEPWHPELVDVMVRAAAACCREAGIPPAMVCGHKEWAPNRKVDPHTLSMSDIRLRIDAALPATPPPDAEEDPLAFATHEERESFVTEAYEDVVGRTPKKAERDPWVWQIAVNPPDALRLLSKLSREHRLSKG